MVNARPPLPPSANLRRCNPSPVRGSGAAASTRAGRIVLAAFVVTVLVGGANSIAVRFSLRELPPFWGASFRFFIATFVVAALVLSWTAAANAAAPRFGAATRSRSSPTAS